MLGSASRVRAWARSSIDSSPAFVTNAAPTSTISNATTPRMSVRIMPACVFIRAPCFRSVTSVTAASPLRRASPRQMAGSAPRPDPCKDGAQRKTPMLDVLVVDDDEIIRASVADALAAAGPGVVQAIDGEHALLLLREAGVRPRHLRRADCPSSTASRCFAGCAGSRPGRPWCS